MAKNNVLIYIRVSTDEQSNQGYSLEYQEILTTRHCELRKYNILQLYKEDYSAKTFERPQWRNLIAYIKANKGLVNKLVFSRWDRFSRNQSDAQSMIKQLEKLNVIIDCVEQPLDLESPETLLTLSIYTAIPEIENRKISIRTIEGMRQASLNGCWVGKKPLGYDRDWILKNTQRKNATLKPNSDAIIVKKIFEYFTKGELSADAIRKRIVKDYDRSISKQGVLDILTNCAYLGKVKVKAYKDEPEMVVKGYHEAIISEDVFKEAHEILSGKRRRHIRKDNKEFFPLKDIIKCSVCGLSFTASVTTKNKGLNKYPYYHCSKTKGHDRFAVDLIHTCFETVLKDSRQSLKLSAFMRQY